MYVQAASECIAVKYSQAVATHGYRGSEQRCTQTHHPKWLSCIDQAEGYSVSAGVSS